MDGPLAVAARLWDDIAIVLDLKSGATRLTIDTGTVIYALGVARNTIAVVGDGNVVTWNLPTGVHVLGARADRNDSDRTIRLDRRVPFWPPHRGSVREVSMSSDLSYVAVSRLFWTAEPFYVTRNICDASTGIRLEQVRSQDLGRSWFSPGGREFWCSPLLPAPGELEGWAIVRDSESDVTKLERLDPTGGPSGGFPWQSSHGCQVTDDGWVLNSTGKGLLWLPPHWRSVEMHRVWSGRFLALLHPGLLEVVVLEVLLE